MLSETLASISSVFCPCSPSHRSRLQPAQRRCGLLLSQRIPMPNVAPSLDRNRRFLFGRGAGRETPRPTRNDAAARYKMISIGRVSRVPVILAPALGS